MPITHEYNQRIARSPWSVTRETKSMGWTSGPKESPRNGSFDAISPWERSDYDLFSERLSQIAVSIVTMIVNRRRR